MALDQPLTNYDDPRQRTGPSGGNEDYFRPTRSSLLRQMPRQSLPEGLGAALQQIEEDDAEGLQRSKAAADRASRARGARGGGGGGGGDNQSVASSQVSTVASPAGTAAKTGTAGAAGGGAGGGRTGATAGAAGKANAAGTSTGKLLATTKPKKGGGSGSLGLGLGEFQGMQADLPGNRYAQRGLKESAAQRAERLQQREHTLEQIDAVLQNLNAHTTGWSERQAVQAMNSLRSRGGHKSEKETMREMREFAHPPSHGVKSLLSMVDDIEAEFNS
jgi:hypothetical protein